MRAVRENIQPRTCCIDRAIARSIQQDRGWIFSRIARRTIVRLQKTVGGKGHARAKYKVQNIWGKKIVKNALG